MIKIKDNSNINLVTINDLNLIDALGYIEDDTLTLDFNDKDDRNDISKQLKQLNVKHSVNNVQDELYRITVKNIKRNFEIV